MLEWKKLFHDHCDGWYTAEYLERNPFSPFETFYDAKGLQLYPDISIDETAFNNFAWETRKNQNLTFDNERMVSAAPFPGDRGRGFYLCSGI